MDFVFDRVAGGRAIKCLAIVDDATHALGGLTPSQYAQQLVQKTATVTVGL